MQRFTPHALALTLALLSGGLAYGALSGAALAQTTVTTGLTTDTTQPIEVEADQLSVDQATGVAVFSGNVRVKQGDLRVTAPKATLNYTEDRSEIQSVHLEGGVRLTNGVEVVQGQDAVYTVADGGVVLTGDVIVTQGASTIAGPRLTYNLQAGSGVMDGGRVQSVFVPGSGTGSEAKE